MFAIFGEKKLDSVLVGRKAVPIKERLKKIWIGDELNWVQLRMTIS
jgi:hypothetical protein